MSEKPNSPPRQRMIDDMNVLRFTPDTRREYIRTVNKLAAFLGCKPKSFTLATEIARQCNMSRRAKSGGPAMMQRAITLG
jgi:hypothetical protein